MRDVTVSRLHAFCADLPPFPRRPRYNAIVVKAQAICRAAISPWRSLLLPPGILSPSPLLGCYVLHRDRAGRPSLSFEDIMEIGIWVLIGVAVGASASWLMAGPRAGGPAVAIAICVVAAIAGGLLDDTLSEPSTIEGFQPTSRIAAVAAALLAMLGFRSWAMRSEPSDLHATR
jgi:uncharacterized membrane protein YeaQ/YmgE (transglycosylase-associated protein family)